MVYNPLKRGMPPLRKPPLTLHGNESVRSRLHVIFALLLVKLTLLLRGCILVLLVLRDKIVHIALSLSELHLIHALSSVPVQERLAAEHGGEVLCDAFEHFLDRRRVPGEGYRHLQPLWWDVTD